MQSYHILKEKQLFFKKYKICYSNVVTYQKINVLNEIEMLNIGDNDNPTTRHKMKNTFFLLA